METLVWYLIPFAGFAGSFHCTLMCGPIVGYAQAGLGNNNSKAGLFRFAAYQAGRFTAYMGLGIVAGTLGRGFFYLSETLKLQQAMWLILGGSMIVMGLRRMPFFKSSIGSRRFPMGTEFRRKLFGGLRRLRGKGGAAAGTLMGLLSGLLPCGFLYSFAFVAGSSGHPGKALLIMAGFWLGTLPALVLAAWGSDLFRKTNTGRINALTPWLLVLFGVLTLIGKGLSFPHTGLAEDIRCLGF